MARWLHVVPSSRRIAISVANGLTSAGRIPFAQRCIASHRPHRPSQRPLRHLLKPSSQEKEEKFTRFREMWLHCAIAQGPAALEGVSLGKAKFALPSLVCWRTVWGRQYLLLCVVLVRDLQNSLYLSGSLCTYLGVDMCGSVDVFVSVHVCACLRPLSSASL